MLKFLSIFLGVFIWMNMGMSQECEKFSLFKAGTEFTWNHFDKKNKLTSTTSNKVIKITPTSSGIDADVKVLAYDKDGDKIFDTDATMNCNGSTISISIQNALGPDQMNAFKDMDVKITETKLNYPHNLTNATVLNDGNFTAEVYSGNLKIMTMKFDISERKVAEKESVTTPAGEFSCVKITYTAKFKALLSMTMQITEWYSPDLGMIVKSESSKNGKPQGMSILAKFVKQ